jgi:hypothetical protein
MTSEKQEVAGRQQRRAQSEREKLSFVSEPGATEGRDDVEGGSSKPETDLISH